MMNRRMRFRTRLGPVLETEVGNSWPIIEIFRDGHYDVEIPWPSVRRVVDVGGHVGAFALWVAARAAHAQITTFEPEPRNFRDLELNVARNDVRDRVTRVNAAVAGHDGRRVLNVPVHRHNASFATAADARRVSVDCVSLERYLQGQASREIDVLKLDCEGAEWEILTSLRRETLRQIRHLLVECHTQREDDIDELIGLLGEVGLTPRIISTGQNREYALVMTLWAAR
jgi:FkbM family methyltransferase